MSVATKPDLGKGVWNVPNQLSGLRLALSIAMFVLIGLEYYLASTVVFLLAASTDWIDGYWARKYGQVTVLGRILDPFVDKIIICGTFIFLVAVPASGVTAWMAVVIVGRELMVTALRNFLEGEGADFSATMSGKLKMVVQCAAAVLALYSLTYSHGTGPAAAPESLLWLRWISLLAAIGLTVYSGVEYILRAIWLLRRLGAP